MARLSIDPRKSKILLIGASRFPEDPDLKDLEGVIGNIERLKKVLTDKRILGFLEENIVELIDPQKSTFEKELNKIGKHATDTIIVYYSGHGIREDEQLYLTCVDSVMEDIYVTGVSIKRVKKLIKKSKAKKRILILDCCHSGKAINVDMGGSEEANYYEFEEMEGTLTLASSPANRISVAKEGHELTEFTKEFVGILEEGLPTGKPTLSIPEIADKIKATFRNRRKANGERIYPPEVGGTLISSNFGFVWNMRFRIFEEIYQKGDQYFELEEYQLAQNEYEKALEFIEPGLARTEVENKISAVRSLRQAEQEFLAKNYLKASQLLDRFIKSLSGGTIKGKLRSKLREYEPVVNKYLDEELKCNFQEEKYLRLKSTYENFQQIYKQLETRYHDLIRQTDQKIEIEKLLDRGDDLYHNKHYLEAKTEFEKCLIIADDQRVRDWIKKCNAALDEAEANLFNLAKEKKSAELYHIFLDQYPASKAKNTVESLLAAKEDDIWERIRSSREIENFYQYLDQFPEGKFNKEAEVRIQEIKRRELKVNDSFHWQIVKNIDSPDSYQFFIDTFPDSNFSQEAGTRQEVLREQKKEQKIRISEAQRQTLKADFDQKLERQTNSAVEAFASKIENDVWNLAKNGTSVQSLEIYQRLYPKGKYGSQAQKLAKQKKRASGKKLLQNLGIPVIAFALGAILIYSLGISRTVKTTPGPGQEDLYFQICREIHTTQVYKAYLQKYPEGTYADSANYYLSAMEAHTPVQPKPDRKELYAWTDAAWEAAVTADFEAIDKYKEKYAANSSLSHLVLAMEERLTFELGKQAFNNGQDKSSLRYYKTHYPDGFYSKEVERLLAR